MDKSMAEEDKTQDDAKVEDYDNVKTIKPDVRSSSLRSLRKVPQLDMPPIIEDYSDLADDDEAGLLLQEKVAKFKVSQSYVHRDVELTHACSYKRPSISTPTAYSTLMTSKPWG